MYTKKINLIFLLLFCVSTVSIAQENDAKKLLDEVSAKMSSYTNMQIAFTSTLSNKDAGIKADDEPPMVGKLLLEGEKYNLEYLGSNFIFDGKKLYVINHDEKEISTNDSDFDAEDGFIYPSELFSFYKEGYNFKLSEIKTINKRKIQLVELTPIDSESDIIKVILGIDINKKHIYQLIQIGSNSSKTTFTITSLKSNQNLPKNTFVFNKDAYLNYSID